MSDPLSTNSIADLVLHIPADYAVPEIRVLLVKLAIQRDDLVAALKRVLDCPAMNEDSQEPESMAAHDAARAALVKVQS